MQPNPGYHTSLNCVGTRVFGHLLEAGDVLEATDLYDSTSGEWSACPTPGLTLGEGTAAVWVRPIGLPEPVDASDADASESAEEVNPDPVVFELPEGKFTLAYVPENNTCSVAIEGKVELGLRELTALGSTFMQAAQYVMHRSGTDPIELLRSMGIEVEQPEGCGRPDCEACSPENFTDEDGEIEEPTTAD